MKAKMDKMKKVIFSVHRKMKKDSARADYLEVEKVRLEREKEEFLREKERFEAEKANIIAQRDALPQRFVRTRHIEAKRRHDLGFVTQE